MGKDNIQAKEEGYEDSVEVRFILWHTNAIRGHIIDRLPSTDISLIIKRP